MFKKLSLIFGLILLFSACGDIHKPPPTKPEYDKVTEAPSCNTQNIDICRDGKESTKFINDEGDTLSYAGGELLCSPSFKGRWNHYSYCFEVSWIKPLQNTLCRDNQTNGEFIWYATDTLYNYSIY